MVKNGKISYYLKIFVAMGCILLFTCIQTHSFTQAERIENDLTSIKEDARNAVVNNLKAQKNCNVDDMIKTSKYPGNISNLKEFYTFVCKEYPLKQADITNLTVINNSLALVSIESKYQDKLFITTTPVLKLNGQWKIIRGIPEQGYANLSDLTGSDKVYKEVWQSITDYSKAVTSGNIDEMKRFRKDLNKSDKFDLDKHLKTIIEKPTAILNLKGIEVISDTLAIAFIETNFEHSSSRDTYAVYKENGGWKIIFGRNLLNTGIPMDNDTIKIK